MVWTMPSRSAGYERVRKSYAGQEVEFVALTTEDPDEAGDAVKKFCVRSTLGFRVGWADREMARTLMNGGKRDSANDRHRYRWPRGQTLDWLRSGTQRRQAKGRDRSGAATEGRAIKTYFTYSQCHGS